MGIVSAEKNLTILSHKITPSLREILSTFKLYNPLARLTPWGLTPGASQ